jgi:hypothetical protein
VPPSSRQSTVASERARQVLHKPLVNPEGSAHPSACASGRSILKIWYGIAPVLVALSGSSTHADRVGYHKVADLSAETDAVRAEHHHDWSSADDARGEIFTEENHYSYLQLREKATGAVLFRRPGPALSHIGFLPIPNMSSAFRTSNFGIPKNSSCIATLEIAYLNAILSA